MISTRLRYLAFFCALLVTIPAFAEEVGVRNYQLPQHGVFRLQVPKSWQDRVSQPQGATPPTIILTAGSGDAFQALLTPIWPAQPGASLPGPAEIKRIVELSADRAKQQSAEQQLVIQEIKGISGGGYYFSATDRAPKPGEFKYLLQGLIRAGELLVSFTVLTQDGGDSIRREAIAMLESATHAKDEVSSSTSTNPGRPDAIQITQTDTSYILTVPVSRLVMQFPKGSLVPAKMEIGGGTSGPRYFYFEDRESQLIASGWFEPQQSFKGVPKFWADEVASWKKGGLPEPQNVTFSKQGGWETIAYEILTSGITNTHLRAHWLQAGTWIDLHLSLRSPQPARESRARLVALLATTSISEKK